LWHVNPLELLNTTEDEWLLLMACAKVIENDRDRQDREAKRNKP